MSSVSPGQLDELLVNVLGKATCSGGDKGMISDLLDEYGRSLEARIVREANSVRVRASGDGWKIEGRDWLNLVLHFDALDAWAIDNMKMLLQLSHARIAGGAVEVWDDAALWIQAELPMSDFVQRYGFVRVSYGKPRKRVTVAITHYTLRRPHDRHYFRFTDHHGLLSADRDDYEY